METAQQATNPKPEIIVVSGGPKHQVSGLVYAEAAKRGWKCHVGKDWSKAGSAFFQECDILVRVEDMPDVWCDEQEYMFRTQKPEHVVAVISY
jgi:hypothetical protein